MASFPLLKFIYVLLPSTLFQFRELLVEELLNMFDMCFPLLSFPCCFSSFSVLLSAFLLGQKEPGGKEIWKGKQWKAPQMVKIIPYTVVL